MDGLDPPSVPPADSAFWPVTTVDMGEMVLGTKPLRTEATLRQRFEHEEHFFKLIKEILLKQE